MAIVKLESGEKVVLWHPPIWVFYCAFLFLFFTAMAILTWAAISPQVDDQAFVFLVIVVISTHFILLCGLGLFVNLARITDRRVIQPRLRPWKENREIRLQEIKDYHRHGWRIVVAGGDKSLSIFCPPAFAPRILAAFDRG